MSLRQRLDSIAEWIKAVCDFIKTVAFYLLEAGAFLLLLYIVAKAAWAAR